MGEKLILSLLVNLYKFDLLALRYSIAWYPIYRIPDGNFRAAFLTYHALGHFVRNTSAVSLGVGASIASPVVGLQSYNAQVFRSLLLLFNCI